MKFGDPGGENTPPSKRLRRSGRHFPNIGEPTLDPNSLCLPSHIDSSSSAYPRATQEAVELGNNVIPSGATEGAQAGTSALIEDQSVSHAQNYPNRETNAGRHSTLRNSEDLGRALDNEDTVDGEEIPAGQNLLCVSQIGMELGNSTEAGTQEEVNENRSTVDHSGSRPQAHDEVVRAGEVEAANSSFRGASQERPSHLLHPEQQEHQTSVLVPVVESDVRSQIPAQQDERVPDALVADVLLGAQDARHAMVVLQAVSSSSAGGSNQFVEVLELSEDEREGAAQEVPTLTSSALSAAEHSPVDPDAFAPEPCPPTPLPVSEVEAESSKPDQFGTQLESEGMTCSICMEPWTSTGSHRICSLACGHLFGNLCIKRWLKQAGKKQGKCPQCNRRARIEDLRTLYVPRLAVVDGDGQQYKQEVGLLRTENEQLKRKVTDLEEQLLRYQTLVRNHSAKGRESSSSFQRPRDQQARFVSGNKRTPSIYEQAPGVMHFPQGVHVSSRHILVFPSQNQQKVAQRTMTETTCRRPLQEVQQNGQNWRGPESSNALTGCLEANLRQQREGSHAARPLRSFSSLASIGSRDGENSFLLQDELPVHGAKVFDMDAHSQLLLVSGKPADCTASSGLTKMSLLTLSEGNRMELPPGIGVIRDIQIAPSGIHAPGRLTLMASAGKKLTLLSLESNNVVISYSLQSPSWACAWDLCNPNQIYAGLQNGSVLKFDMRQTSSPLATLQGLSSSPIHTLQYVPEGERLRSGGSSGHEGNGLLSASSSSLLYWPGINQSEQSRPVCLSRPGGSSVCVSLCYNAAVDMLVGSFKPKPVTVILNEGSASSSTPPLLASPTDTAYSHATSSSTRQDDNSPSTSISVHIPTHFSYSRKSEMPTERGDFSAVHTNSVWEQRTAMVGHKSQLLMSRTTIVKDWTNRNHAQIGTSEGGQGCLFASGDDGSNSVWLWDVGCPNVKQMLTPHPTPVLDIRNTHVAGMDLLGCVSERKLQIYRQMPL